MPSKGEYDKLRAKYPAASDKLIDQALRQSPRNESVDRFMRRKAQFDPKLRKNIEANEKKGLLNAVEKGIKQGSLRSGISARMKKIDEAG
jgi:hypothetical protein